MFRLQSQQEKSDSRCVDKDKRRRHWTQHLPLQQKQTPGGGEKPHVTFSNKRIHQVLQAFTFLEAGGSLRFQHGHRGLAHTFTSSTNPYILPRPLAKLAFRSNNNLVSLEDVPPAHTRVTSFWDISRVFSLKGHLGVKLNICLAYRKDLTLIFVQFRFI